MNSFRRERARQIRYTAADLAFNRPHPRHVANDDEQKFRRVIEEKGENNNKPSYLTSFTKGMPHDYKTGLLLNPDDFEWFIRAIDSGDVRDFIDTPLGPPQEDGDEEPDPENPKWKSHKAKGAKLRAWESQGAGLAFDLEGPDCWAVTMPPAPALGSDELIAEMAEVYAQALLRDVPFTDIVKGHGEIECQTF
ncbi:MAG: bromoperoxidase, partial [Chloroflexota bacterium]